MTILNLHEFYICSDLSLIKKAIMSKVSLDKDLRQYNQAVKTGSQRQVFTGNQKPALDKDIFILQNKANSSVNFTGNSSFFDGIKSLFGTTDADTTTEKIPAQNATNPVSSPSKATERLVIDKVQSIESNFLD